jgi:serine/threonine protein kinase
VRPELELSFSTTICVLAARDRRDAGSNSGNVVALLDCVRKDDRTSLIFELVEGRDFVKDLPYFTERDVARYMKELFVALAHVHRRVIAVDDVSIVTNHICLG